MRIIFTNMQEDEKEKNVRDDDKDETANKAGHENDTKDTDDADMNLTDESTEGV